MKSLTIHMYVLLAGILMFLGSCSTKDNEIAWGQIKVYMPQAAISDGGLTHNYLVPLNNNASTNNYKIDSTGSGKTLKIVLGVYRSGLQELEAFKVDVAVDESASAAASAAISKGVQLPSDVYSLPAEVAVENGQRESIFYLDVDLNKLISDYPGYATRKMVLVVGISNPTKYELNDNLSKTTVVIDGPSFMPAPKIVNGGDFEAGSEQYWNFLNVVGSLPESYATISNGALVFDYGTTAVAGEWCVYNSIELVSGKKYKFSCDFISTGGSAVTNCRFYMAVSPVKPVIGPSYKYSVGSACDSYLDAWNGMKNPVNGKLPQNGGWQDNIDKSTGIFTSNFTGTGYVVFGVAAWTSSIGRITIDNVKIEEVE